MILKLKNVLPNPFRDLKTNPLIEEKIVGLMESITLTGFWENVVVRKNSDGRYELAYGHHRLEAAIRAGIVEADFIVKNFDDAKMIQVMDNENRETYGSTPQSIIESVKAVVQALAKGSIPTFEIDEKVRKDTLRYAPSYVPGHPCENSEFSHPYTALNIAQFLGRVHTQTRGTEKTDKFIVAALDALFLKEKGRFSDSMLKKKDETGEIVPITMSELRKRTGEIKRDYARVAERSEEAKLEAIKFDAEQRRIQNERRITEEKAEANRKALVEKLAASKREENDKKTREIKERIEAKKKDEEEKLATLSIRQAALNEKVEKAKQAQEAARKVDEYAPIRREADRILHKMEQSKEALTEDVKALSRQKLNNTDRERLRQAALTIGEWYGEWVAMLFLPPLSSKRRK